MLKDTRLARTAIEAPTTMKGLLDPQKMSLQAARILPSILEKTKSVDLQKQVMESLDIFAAAMDRPCNVPDCLAGPNHPATKAAAQSTLQLKR